MVIRKISIGSDYKNAMHYIVGQTVLDGNYKIHNIIADGTFIEIWIENSIKEVIKWKSFNVAMPMAIEFNINF